MLEVGSIAPPHRDTFSMDANADGKGAPTKKNSSRLIGGTSGTANATSGAGLGWKSKAASTVLRTKR